MFFSSDFKSHASKHELQTPLQFKQLSAGQSREGTAEGLNHQVEFYYDLDTNPLLGGE